MIAVKSRNAERVMNYKFIEEHKIISKTRKNFGKNKRIINIRNDPFQKICCMSVIEIESDHNLKSRSLKFLKLLTFNFSFVNQIH